MGSGWGRQQMSGFGRQALSSSGMAHQGHDCVTGNAMEHFWALQFGWLLFLYYYFGVLQPQKGWLVLLLTVGLSTGLSIDSLLELLHRLPQLLALWHGTQERMTMNVKVHHLNMCHTVFLPPQRPFNQPIWAGGFIYFHSLKASTRGLSASESAGYWQASCLLPFFFSPFCVLWSIQTKNVLRALGWLSQLFQWICKLHCFSTPQLSITV